MPTTHICTYPENMAKIGSIHSEIVDVQRDGNKIVLQYARGRPGGLNETNLCRIVRRERRADSVTDRWMNRRGTDCSSSHLIAAPAGKVHVPVV